MLTVVPTDSRPLSWPPIGALPRNRLASSATGSASPISPTPRLLHSLKRFRRARCPHPAARCPLCPLQKNVSLRSQCAHWLWQSASPALCLRRPPFFLRRKKGGKERRQNQGFEILSAAEVLPVPVSFSHANQDKQISCLAFTWSLRLHLRCAPCLCWPILTGLFSASLVGRGAHTPPPKFA